MHEAADRLRPVAEGLYELQHPRRGYRPEDAGKALAKLQGGELAIAAVREGAAWLLRVAEVAESVR